METYTYAMLTEMNTNEVLMCNTIVILILLFSIFSTLSDMNLVARV